MRWIIDFYDWTRPGSDCYDPRMLARYVRMLKGLPVAKGPKEWSVYIVRCADDSLYTGIAKDVDKRLAAHNSGRGAAYTRPRRPVCLVYREGGLTRPAALVREARIKALGRPGKEALLAARTFAAAALLLFAAGTARAVPTFNQEGPVVFSSAAPQAFTGTYPSLRMYFIRQSSQTEVGSALSADGIAWTEDSPVGRLSTTTLPSVSASSVTGCGVLSLSGGGYRMLYSIISTTGAFRIHSATSTNGLNWANDAGTRIEVAGGATYVAGPKLVTLNDGSWRLYYIGDINGGNDIGDRQIFSSRSTDEGLTWSSPSLVVSTLAYELGASKLTDGRVRLYFSQPLSGTSSATVVSSALSSDSNGSSFSLESGYRVSTSAASGTLAFPVPVRSTDSFRWRLYYDFFDPSVITTAPIHTALTGPPAPTAMSPSTVLRTQSTYTFTVSGEIFSLTAPTLQLSMAGQQSFLPASVTRTDDQTLTAVFNVFQKASGHWDLAVTNADGNSATLASALFIDFPGGSLSLTNNLLRPRNGQSTAISITTFNSGRTSVKIYALDGRLVRTLYDFDQPQGNLVLSWDGRDASGTAVASGLYIVRVLAPRLDAKGKIVVIR